MSHTIIDNSLTLGAIPLRNRGHVVEMTARGLPDAQTWTFWGCNESSAALCSSAVAKAITSSQIATSDPFRQQQIHI